MNCFARLVRAVLGKNAISEDKLCFGASLTLLGVEIELTSQGYKCQPQLEKRLRSAFVHGVISCVDCPCACLCKDQGCHSEGSRHWYPRNWSMPKADRY